MALAASTECDKYLCKRKGVPFKPERDRIYDVDVQSDQQTSGALVPAKDESINLTTR
jgi:hypothetical protein